jgi:diaminohydroxyphosphoribosylaminopyrimidine deaminase / 5-amino-6-(5-phosphoribosylamino)uracil reductase
MLDDRYFMTSALNLAEKGRGFTSPNPMVGAVVVKDHRIIGRGFHEAAGKPHAEVNAIDSAKEDPKDAVLYVTLEPCNHMGRTPPCTQKIISAGIKRVVTAMEDPNPHVVGGGNKYLRQMGVEVVVGVCEQEAKKQNEVFVKFVKTKRPFVILKWASTLDGRIASRTGDAKWISNALSREKVHEIRHGVDAIMVGIGTVAADNPKLTTRLPGFINGKKKGRNPLRIILDSTLSIPEDANVLGADAKTFMITGDLSVSPEKLLKKKRLAEKGVRVLEAPVTQSGIDLSALLGQLGDMGITSLLIEGGSRVIASALSKRIVDQVILFYGPKILCGNDGIPVTSGKGPEKISAAVRLKDISTQHFGDDLMIKGYPVYPD